jgi:hypothetical protein
VRTLNVNADNDLVLNELGYLSFATDIDAVLLTARQYASTLLGEMIHAADEGIPYFGVAFGSSPNIAQFEAGLRRRLLQCPGVIRIDELTAQQVGDTLGYTATITTEFGQGTVNG